jgi:hypothetical protein
MLIHRLAIGVQLGECPRRTRQQPTAGQSQGMRRLSLVFVRAHTASRRPTVATGMCPHRHPTPRVLPLHLVKKGVTFLDEMETHELDQAQWGLPAPRGFSKGARLRRCPTKDKVYGGRVRGVVRRRRDVSMPASNPARPPSPPPWPRAAREPRPCSKIHVWPSTLAAGMCPRRRPTPRPPSPPHEERRHPKH